MTTVSDVAGWMLRELRASAGGVLYQEHAAARIAEQFGEAFVYTNENGNVAISRDVLTAFRDSTQGRVVWVSNERCWRLRLPADLPSRRAEE